MFLFNTGFIYILVELSNIRILINSLDRFAIGTHVPSYDKYNTETRQHFLYRDFQKRFENIRCTQRDKPSFSDIL